MAFKYAKNISDDKTKVLCETTIDDYDAWPQKIQWVVIYNPNSNKFTYQFRDRWEYFIPKTKIATSIKEAATFIKSEIKKEQTLLKKAKEKSKQMTLWI